MTILAFIFGVVITLVILRVVAHCKDTQPKNKVHFYVARDKDGELWLYLSKPVRGSISFLHNTHGSTIVSSCGFEYLGLNEDDYKDLKWEDKPVEVFLNLED